MKSKGAFYTQKQKKILSTLGENIKLARLRRRFSIRSMAERAGIAASTFSFSWKLFAGAVNIAP